MTAILSFVLKNPSFSWDSQHLCVSFQNSADNQVSTGTPQFGSPVLGSKASIVAHKTQVSLTSQKMKSSTKVWCQNKEYKEGRAMEFRNTTIRDWKVVPRSIKVV